jgi:aminoglycoside phosphotransferase (APT) family kinase protein
MTTMVSRHRHSSYETALAASLREFVGTQLGRPITVEALRKLAGGTAHETWAFDVHEIDGSQLSRLVLRRDFEQGMLDGDTRTEFELLTALDRLGVAVPGPRWCVVQDSPLEQPFMIVDRVDGTDIRKHLVAHPDTDRHRLGQQLVRQQVELHQLDWQSELPPASVADHSAEDELRKWTRLIDAAETNQGPLLSAAAGWLEDHIPPATPRRLVHGDFKANNLLFGPACTVTVLDWELAHIGDPVEDIAWTMLWTTRFDLVGGLLSAEEYRAAYEAESGAVIEPDLLLFWRIFALVKLSAIFLTGVARGGSQARPTLQLMGRGIYHLETELAELLRSTLGEMSTR